MGEVSGGSFPRLNLSASLPMYNLPEMRADNARFWHAVRTEAAGLGVEALPEELDFGRLPVPPGIGAEVVFSQVCGWPLQTIYGGQAVVLGVPDYEAAYCEGARHAGVFVVGRHSGYRTLEDLRGCRFVYNSLHSNSGMNLPRRAVAGVVGGGAFFGAFFGEFFGAIEETHSQPGNLERVARGEADATCVDCVTYAFFGRHRPALAAGLRVLVATVSTPALPFVTAESTPVGIRALLSEALQRVGRGATWAAAREGLMLRGIAAADVADYGIPCRYAEEAVALGYPVLR